MLYLGYDGAVDPTKYLQAWARLQDVPIAGVVGWAPPLGGGGPEGRRDPAQASRHLDGERARPGLAAPGVRAVRTPSGRDGSSSGRGTLQVPARPLDRG